MSDQEQEQGFIGAGHADPELSLTPLALVPEFQWEHVGELSATPTLLLPGAGSEFIPIPFAEFGEWIAPAETHFMWFVSAEILGPDTPGDETRLTFDQSWLFDPDITENAQSYVFGREESGWSGVMGASATTFGGDGTLGYKLGVTARSSGPIEVTARNLKVAIYRFQ